MVESIERFPMGEIDTSAPFESVSEAVSRFGGFGFWKPSSLNISHASPQNEVDEDGMLVKASDLEKELICKEGEILKVLKSLESTKSVVEELKSKLQRKEDKENCHVNIFKELDQAKMNLCRTTKDLAALRESIELLNNKLEKERALLEKTQERLTSENAAEMSKEIHRLSNETMEFSRTGEKARYVVDKAVAQIEAAEMRLIASRKMKEAANAAEAVAIAELKAVKRKRNGEETMQEGILETIEETTRDIRSSRRTLEEGLEKMKTAIMEAEEGTWLRSKQRRRRPSCPDKFLMDLNGLKMMINTDGTASSVSVLRPTMTIGQILSRKLLMADESTNERVSLGKILGMTNIGERKEKEKSFNGKRKRSGFANYLSVILNKESKKKTKKKKINLNLS